MLEALPRGSDDESGDSDADARPKKKAVKRKSINKVTTGHAGPRAVLSSDTCLASLVVLDEDGALERLHPSFQPHRMTYNNAMPLPVNARKVSIIATARNRHAMVNIHRWDASACSTTRKVIETLSRTVCVSHTQDLLERATTRVQACGWGQG